MDTPKKRYPEETFEPYVWETFAGSLSNNHIFLFFFFSRERGSASLDSLGKSYLLITSTMEPSAVNQNDARKDLTNVTSRGQRTRRDHVAITSFPPSANDASWKMWRQQRRTSLRNGVQRERTLPISWLDVVFEEKKKAVNPRFKWHWARGSGCGSYGRGCKGRVIVEASSSKMWIMRLSETNGAFTRLRTCYSFWKISYKISLSVFTHLWNF